MRTFLTVCCAGDLCVLKDIDGGMCSDEHRCSSTMKNIHAGCAPPDAARRSPKIKLICVKTIS